MRVALLLSSLALVGALHAERIQWVDGTWDDSPPPKGSLLTDCPNWWGESIFTGVRSEEKPGEVVYDFRLECHFCELDILRCPGISGQIDFSSDGETWTHPTSFAVTSGVCRVRLDPSIRARYVRVGHPRVKHRHFVAWGDCPQAPEPPRIAVGNALVMSARRDGEVALYSVPDPSSQKGAEPRLPCAGERPVEHLAITMARREIETRYFALVNEGSAAVEVALGVDVPGEKDLSAEWRLAGLVRIDPPVRKLSEKELFDMLLTEQIEKKEIPGGKLAFRPFFAAAEKPSRRFLQRRVANVDQVLGFPSAVPLRPGEGALLMLRLRTDDATSNVRRPISLRIGSRSIPGVVTIADIELSSKKPWVYAWSPFTRQYPFECESRVVADAEAMLELGVTHYAGIPEEGTRGHYIMKREPQSTFATLVTDKTVFHQVYNGRSELTDDDRRVISNDLAITLAKVRASGLPLARFAVELPDEPHEGNALGIGRMAKYVKEIHPELNVFSDPSFWTKRGCFADAETIVRHLGWFYNDCVDISVPYRSNVEDPVKRDKLFCCKRLVNAQYAHPARRAGRSIAWSSFRYGLDGFAFWAYYTPKGDPWDIRTWTMYDYDQVEMVFPLEKGVALTCLYELMREAAEDYRLLMAVRKAGKTRELEAILAEFGAAFDPAAAETARPYDCDFLALRERLLGLFVSP